MKTHTTEKGTQLQVSNLKGKDYLEVKYRVVWFREERPNWGIETEFMQLTDAHAVAKAIIRDENGRIVAMGHKREDQKHFADFSEKAETGAIGRALALCGYGTQFVGDEFDEGDRIVDSPVPPPASKPELRVAAPTKAAVEVCDCGNKMMISKYGAEPRPWYCGKCKATRPR